MLSLVKEAAGVTEYLLPPLPNTLYTRDTTCWIYGGVHAERAVTGRRAMKRPFSQRRFTNSIRTSPAKSMYGGAIRLKIMALRPRRRRSSCRSARAMF